MAVIIFFYCWYQKQETCNVRGSVMAKHKELDLLFGEKLFFLLYEMPWHIESEKAL